MVIDRRFRHRVVRLMITSLLALSSISLLAFATLETSMAVRIGLAAGSLLMPLTLGLSLRWPTFQNALIIPSLLVSLSLLAICGFHLPTDRIARAGWLLITVGIMAGGALGAWFWFRWAPVPATLADPFSSGRWALIGIHAGLVVAGLAIVGTSALS